jgi:uroporphyrin-III C-methyltransferase / precorrin-2 dehydrogenase / sirohydrochlorin ferrochelatase
MRGVTSPVAPEPLFPVGVRLRDRRVVVVGGGRVALRRVAALVQAGARVAVVAPDVTPALAAEAAAGRISWVRRNYREGDLEGAWLSMACTDDRAVNTEVAAEAERARIFCSRADDAAGDDASAWVPAVGRHADLTVAVHADRDPSRAAAVRDLLVDELAQTSGTTRRVRPRPGPGRVVLVGGGPGDPGLLTLRGRSELARADVVVTDRLAPMSILDDLDPAVLVVDASKAPGGHAMAQDEINALLVRHARQGDVVVRLKGGDPYVFGRGAEEVDACVAAGIRVDVVPGVTSAVAVPGLAGVPVTRRGIVQAFTVVSGHVPPDDPSSSVDWGSLAAFGATIVVLMGVANMPAIAAALGAGGLAPHTPVAVLEDGAEPRATTLAAVAGGAGVEGVSSPAVFVVGDVAAALRARTSPAAGATPR